MNDAAAPLVLAEDWVEEMACLEVGSTKGLNPYGEEEGGEWIALENTCRGRPNDRAVVPSESHFSSVDQIEVRDKSWTTEVKADREGELVDGEMWG